MIDIKNSYWIKKGCNFSDGWTIIRDVKRADEIFKNTDDDTLFFITEDYTINPIERVISSKLYIQPWKFFDAMERVTDEITISKILLLEEES